MAERNNVRNRPVVLRARLLQLPRTLDNNHVDEWNHHAGLIRNILDSELGDRDNIVLEDSLVVILAEETKHFLKLSRIYEVKLA